MSNSKIYESEKEKELKKAPATVVHLPSFSGDGYGYGGGVVLAIGDKAVPFGEGYDSQRLAEEVARRWNAALSRNDEAQP